MAIVKAIMIGDVVGDDGLVALENLLPLLVRDHGADFVVVNGENAANGFGLTGKAAERIFAAGADAISTGNHVWEKRDFWPVLEKDPRILRPANYPPGTPGRGWYRAVKGGLSWAVVNLQGRELMTPIDCPFRAFDSLLPSVGEGAIVLVDFHAESAREKEALGYYVDGRASVVAGTHTHVQTADGRLLPGGSAYITDLGMTGIAEAVIGMDTKICLERARTQVLHRMEPARAGPGRVPVVMGIVAEIDGETRKALSIARISRR